MFFPPTNFARYVVEEQARVRQREAAPPTSACHDWLSDRIRSAFRAITGRTPAPAPIAPETPTQRAATHISPPEISDSSSSSSSESSSEGGAIAGAGTGLVQEFEEEEDDPIEVTYLSSGNSTVHEAELEKWPALSRIAKIWSNTSRDRLDTLRRRGALNAHPTFENSLYICESISNQLITPEKERPRGSDPWDTTLICEDEHRQLQAIALFDKRSNTLAYIATNPENISHDTNRTQVRGAATQILLHLAKETLQNGSALKLKSVDDALHFYYTKFHFEYDVRTPEDARNDLWPLQLTAAKIKALVAKGIPPFESLKPTLS